MSRSASLESGFQDKVRKRIKSIFPDSLVFKMDQVQGIPDLLVLVKDRWFSLELKLDKIKKQPNQDYYVSKMNDMSFSRFVTPSTLEEVLNEIQDMFGEKKDEGNRMVFNTHKKYMGSHAILSASKYHWLRYDEERLIQYVASQKAVKLGIELHDLAATMITHRIYAGIPDGVNDRYIDKTLMMHVNDAIDHNLTAEQMVYYSDYCYGTVDAIGFENNVLRIQDFKSGHTMAHMDQLSIYSAIFCLEYNINPIDIIIELAIYQLGEKLEYSPPWEETQQYIDTVVACEKIVRKADADSKQK